MNIGKVPGCCPVFLSQPRTRTMTWVWRPCFQVIFDTCFQFLSHQILKNCFPCRVFSRQLNRLNPRINMSNVELLFSAKSWSCQVTPWSRQRSFLWVVSRAAVRLVILRFFFTLDYILHIWSVRYTYEAYCTYGYYFTQKVETMK